MTALTPKRKAAQLAEVRPTAAAEQAYRRALAVAVKAMGLTVADLVERDYGRMLDAAQAAGTVADPEHAADASPTDGGPMFRALRNLRDRWSRHFDKMAHRIAAEFVQAAYQANRKAWQSRTEREGFDVPMQLTAAQKTIQAVKVQDNVALIRSIPEEYFTKIEGAVSRGFLAGRDLASIATEVRATGESTVKRAALIARDQSNKLTAQMNSARQRELGITYAYWKHSTVDKDPRPGHLRASREQWIFDTQAGIDFGDAFGQVLPGVAINCRCGSRSIIPGFDKPIDAADLDPVAGFPGAFRLKGAKKRK